MRRTLLHFSYLLERLLERDYNNTAIDIKNDDVTFMKLQILTSPANDYFLSPLDFIGRLNLLTSKILKEIPLLHPATAFVANKVQHYLPNYEKVPFIKMVRAFSVDIGCRFDDFGWLYAIAV